MKKHHNIQLSRLLAVFLLVAALFAQAIPIQSANAAAQITNRSLTLQRRSTTGGSTPSGVVNHKFTFDLVSTSDVGSIQFEYCEILPTSSSADCSAAPTGLSTTSATLGTQTGDETFSSLVNTTAAHPYITRTPEAVTAGAYSVVLEQVTNPSAVNKTFFVRISTWPTAVPSGTPTDIIDAGNVAASTATALQVSGSMPESLVFCTGLTIAIAGVDPNDVPNCNAATEPNIAFDQLFSPSDTSTATSQMAASTNAGYGYAISVHGATMTSGANTINAMSTQAAPATGVSQFGLNLVLNTTTLRNTVGEPALGADVWKTTNGTNFRGQAIGDYNDDDLFKFVPDYPAGTAETVADSLNGGAGPYSSDAQIYTVSYIVNVPGSQPAGEYTTTLTYVCTPTF